MAMSREPLGWPNERGRVLTAHVRSLSASNPDQDAEHRAVPPQNDRVDVPVPALRRALARDPLTAGDDYGCED